MTVIMIVAGFRVHLGVAYMAGLVGSSNNPGLRHHDLRRSCSRRCCCVVLMGRGRGRSDRSPRS
jgi:hypothetical protein